MASGYKSANVDFDDLFDPDVVGDGPAAAGYKVGGVPLKYAAISYGSKRADIGYAESGVDLSNKWAAKGSAVYNLPINDTSYTATQSGINGSAQLIFSMRNDGTYAIERSIRGVHTTLASGTWLPVGDSVANYTAYFASSQSGVTLSGDASFNNGTNAPASTPVSLSTTLQYTADASTFTESGAIARQTVSVTCSYFRLGVLVHAVHVDFTTNSTS